MRVYEYDGSSWEPLGQAISGEYATDTSGHSVSLIIPQIILLIILIINLD